MRGCAHQRKRCAYFRAPVPDTGASKRGRLSNSSPDGGALTEKKTAATVNSAETHSPIGNGATRQAAPCVREGPWFRPLILPKLLQATLRHNRKPHARICRKREGAWFMLVTRLTGHRAWPAPEHQAAPKGAGGRDAAQPAHLSLSQVLGRASRAKAGSRPSTRAWNRAAPLQRVPNDTKKQSARPFP